MNISKSCLKKLFARSGNLCAMCREILSDVSPVTENVWPMHEMAHIAGRKKGAARHENLVDLDLKDKYENLILLCPNCHTKIDNDIASWPYNKIIQIKTNHEYEVRKALEHFHRQHNTKKINQAKTIIKWIIDTCNINNWDNWTWQATHSGRMSWDYKVYSQIFQLKYDYATKIWPDHYYYAELNFACDLFVDSVTKALNLFSEHCEPQYNNGDFRNIESYVEVKFYKIPSWNPALFDDLQQEYINWCTTYYELMVTSTKALNWIVECVQNLFNNELNILEHKFHLQEDLYEFSPQEKTNLLSTKSNISKNYSS